ncbi:MAG: paraquat-inducible protein A, partial [Shimia sp.]
TVLIRTKQSAAARVAATSLAVLILIVSAVFLPFLEISAAGVGNRTSLLDVATTFGTGPIGILSVVALLVIVLVPLARVSLLAWVLTPIVLRRPPLAGAARAFRIAQELKPWSMTEIFALGCAVALVKVADLAQLAFGPGFWMFVILSVLILFNDRYVCANSIWDALERDA